MYDIYQWPFGIMSMSCENMMAIVGTALFF